MGKASPIFWIVLLALPVAAAAWCDLWVLTAAPIGFVLGFCLHKGELCPAAALSEAVAFREWRKLAALGVTLSISLAGFALLQLCGWVRVNPQHCLWVANLVGGALFGIGMVLAGGCVTGCLYKAAAGNVNSVAGLAGIVPGVLLVRYGPLEPVREALQEAIVRGDGGRALSLHGIAGIPFPWIALGIALLVSAVSLLRMRESRPGQNGAMRESRPGQNGASAWRTITTRPWKPWQAGTVAGILAVLAFVSSAASGRNYPLGTTSGATQPFLLLAEEEIAHVYERTEDGKPTKGGAPARKIEWWEVILVATLCTGAAVSARLSGAKILPKPPGQTIVALFGGFLVGVGAAIGSGCFFGHVLSGWAQLSVGSLLFGAALLSSVWATTHIYMIGLKR